MTSILIILGIITLWIWILNQDNGLNPDYKRITNAVAILATTVWLLIELVKAWVRD